MSISEVLGIFAYSHFMPSPCRTCSKETDSSISHRSVIVHVSIEEVPAESEVECAGIDGIVWRPEGASRALIHMVHGHIESAVLEMKVDVDVHDGIVAHLDPCILLILYGKLSH